MAWMQSHHNAYRKAVESCFSLPWYFPPALLPQSSYDNQAAYPQSFYDHHLAWQNYPCSSSHFGRSGQHPHYSSRIQASTREDQTLSKEEEMETESDAEVECDLSNMEITEELRQYFAETERHREERHIHRCTKPISEIIRVNGCRKVERSMKMHFYRKSENGDCPVTSGLHLSWGKGCAMKTEDQSEMAPVLLACTCVLGGS
ncbi:PREDICTED: gem-associated protein 8 isoform X2 [Colobus angolensis palliatus]|uniref:gem-associated protein 8 isoform X2 n=1 Tax=Colobus angolensis palliatus TaxID=336983 RepID=UPI0005F3ABAB|nr:PREDICTED: gem-associated protein 8 isoform X2 [Colobus angolensis palliatus]